MKPKSNFDNLEPYIALYNAFEEAGMDLKSPEPQPAKKGSASHHRKNATFLNMPLAVFYFFYDDLKYC